MTSADFVVYRNVWSGAVFVVVGDEAAARMDALASWRRA